MTRARYLWTLALTLGLPLLVMVGFPILGSLVWPNCNEASGSPCVGVFFGYLYAMIFVFPVILAFGALVVVWRRCKAVGVPRVLCVAAAVLAPSLSSLPMVPSQLGHLTPGSLAAILPGPLCLMIVLLMLALIPDRAAGGQHGSTLGAVVAIDLAALVVASPLSVYRMALRLPYWFGLPMLGRNWPVAVWVAVVVLAGAASMIVLERRSRVAS